MKRVMLVLLLLGGIDALAADASGSTPAYHESTPLRYDLAVRASQIDPRTRVHPEINFLFADQTGKVLDLEHATVDTRVESRGKLVIWLMNNNAGLFERIASYGLHGINVDNTTPPYGNTRQLITNSDVKNNPNRAHTTVVPGGAAFKNASGSYIHEAVWRYLFTHPAEGR